MYKRALILCVLLRVVGNCFGDNIHVTIEINGVTVNNGLVYAAVYSNESDYKNDTAFTRFILQPDNTTLTYLLDLPEGEYVVSVFQDRNGDEKPNSTIFGIPTEHIGITNYNRRGAPGAFNRLKTSINNSSTRLIVNMGKVRLL